MTLVIAMSGGRNGTHQRLFLSLRAALKKQLHHLRVAAASGPSRD
jgi:hypothetical protein